MLNNWDDSQSGLVPIKDKIDKEKAKERWVEHFENLLNRDKVTGNDIEKNERVFNNLKVNEDLFFEDELETLLKDNKATGAGSVVNQFWSMAIVKLEINHWILWTWFSKKGKKLITRNDDPF